MTIIDRNITRYYKRRRLSSPSSVDRLTSLPIDLLIRILSMLPTKDVAATQVLSKRMKQQAFCGITSIDLDNSHLLHCVNHCNIVEKFSVFESFTDNLLHKLSQSHQPLTHFKLYLDGHKTDVGPVLPCYRKCRLNCFPNPEPTRLYAWISYPLAHCGSLRELDLRFIVRNPRECKLPPGLFACQSLEVLKLDSNLEINGVEEIPLIRLPSLRMLHLYSLVFTEDDFVTRLVSNCPVLEDLFLNCKWMKADQLIITSTSLRRLDFLVSKYNYLKKSELLIETPNLEFITYTDNFPWKCSIPHMNSLVKASIFLVYLGWPVVTEIDASFHINLSFLIAVSNVQRLSLNHFALETLMSAGELKYQLPIFRNLKTLKLGGLWDEFYPGVRWDIVLLPILHRSPMLETIVFAQGFFEHFQHYQDGCGVSGRGDSEIGALEGDGWKTTNIPLCLRDHLRKIVIVFPCGCDRELNLLKFLLGNATVLKEIVICHSNIGLRRYGIQFDGHADRFNKALEELPKEELDRGLTNDIDGDTNSVALEHAEITDSMRMEMEYNSDRAWYDREEGSTIYDADSSSFYLGDDTTNQKKEVELAKRLVRRDGSLMSRAQSKKVSQMSADKQQWEDRQLLRSGAVRGTEVQTEIDHEEENKVLLVHGRIKVKADRDKSSPYAAMLAAQDVST